VFASYAIPSTRQAGPHVVMSVTNHLQKERHTALTITDTKQKLH